MFKSTFFIVMVVAIMLVVVAILVPGQKNDDLHYFPWNITPTDDGSITVFGLTLGQSTLRDIENRLQEEAVVSMFREKDDGSLKVEAYFDRSSLAGFRAKMVVELSLTEQQLQDYFDRGLRIAKAGGDKHKVTMTEKDIAQVYKARIATLTYLPRANLNEELVSKRFGEPSEKITEKKGIVHWLYPDKGLDVVIHAEAKEVLQYIPPKDFKRVLAPLLALKKSAED